MEHPIPPQVPQLDSYLTLKEVGASHKSLKNKKYTGEDSISGDILKYHKFYTSFLKPSPFLETRKISDSWKCEAIVTIYKKKGDTSDYGNSSDISLLNAACKIFAHVMFHHLLHHMLHRLLHHLTDIVPLKSPAGF